MKSNADIILRWYAEVWTQVNFDTIDLLYHPIEATESESEYHCISRTELKELITVLHSLISDLRVDVKRMVKDGDWVAAHVLLQGFRAGTQNPVSLSWIAMFRIKGDHIVESYPSTNFITLFEQLGQLPKDTFELLLGGTVLK